MNLEIFHKLDKFVSSSLTIKNLSQNESPVEIKTGRPQHFKSTDIKIIKSNHDDKSIAENTVEMIHKKQGTNNNLLERNLTEFVKKLKSATPDNSNYPVTSEIALTYRCQNRCDFCYAIIPSRRNNFSEMTTDQIKLIIDKIHNDADVHSISFTGGEPTIRKDLSDIIYYAFKKGMKTNLITNGIKCSDKDIVKKLFASGLNSAQVSLESHDEFIQNRITGNIESYKKTLEGIHNLIDAGVQTHTNTTICRGNKEHLIPLVKFVKDEFSIPYLSMNMIIAAGITKYNDHIKIGYSSISAILEPVIDYCEDIGIKLVWHSPTPYCIFNPMDYKLGSKSCKCITGLISINPAGEIIPCSKYSRGIGSLLNDSFYQIWNSDEALYFREKKYIPPVCKKCSSKNLCKGACPLYWDNAGSYREIEKINKRRPVILNFLRFIKNRFRLRDHHIIRCITAALFTTGSLRSLFQ